MIKKTKSPYSPLQRRGLIQTMQQMNNRSITQYEKMIESLEILITDIESDNEIMQMELDGINRELKEED